MSDYYYTPSGEERRGRRTPLPMRMLDFLLAIVSTAVAILVLLSMLAPVIDPHSMWILSMLGLAAPLLYGSLLLLILYWIVRWRWLYAAPMLLVALIGAGKVPRFYRLNIMRDYSDGQAVERGSFTVMTYNIGNFLPYFADGSEPQIAAEAAAIDSLSPDIICLQEFQSTPACPREMFDTLLRSRDYRPLVSLRLVTHPEQGHGVGNAIYTRYRIVRSGTIDNRTELDSTDCIAMWADLTIGDDTVRVVNNHLRTTSITRDDQEYLVSGTFIEDESEAREGKLRSIASRFRINSQIRAAQADTISRFIAASPYKVIVCGDFNDGPMSYAYNRIGRRLDDAFVERGRGSQYTYRGFFNLLRIDFIFVDERFEVLEYSSPHIGASDHYPVVARLKIRGK